MMRRSGLAIVALVAVAAVAVILAVLGVFSANEKSTLSPRAPDQAETADAGGGDGKAETAVATEAAGEDATPETDGDAAAGNESSGTRPNAETRPGSSEQDTAAGGASGDAGETTATDDGSAPVEGSPAGEEASPSARDEAAAGGASDDAGGAPATDDGSAPVGGAPAGEETSATAGDETVADDGTGEQAAGDGSSSSETAGGRAAREEPAPAERRDAGNGSSPASVAAEAGRDLPAIEPTGQMPAPAESRAARETPAPARSEPDPELQREAESFVSELSEPSQDPLAVDELDTFVTGDRPLSPTPQETGADTPPEPQRDREGKSAAQEAGDRDRQQADAGTAKPPAPIPKPQGEVVAPRVVELPVSEQAPVTIAELLGAEEVIPSNAVFYVHTVQPEDNQGIWGIIHDGIIDNFAEGVAMRRGGASETYRIDIPRHADERQADQSSSFLGRLIYEKSRQSYVYNYQTNRVGKNPDLIVPGQEIVIVAFTPEELIAIYKHFVRSQGG